MANVLHAELAWPLKAELGEGPVWVGERLFFVDILNAAVHALTPATGHKQSWRMPGLMGWLIPCREPGLFLGGLENRIVRLRLEPRLEIATLVQTHHDPAIRLNDAKLDPWGNLWAGSMHKQDQTLAVGVLGRLNRQAQWQRVDIGHRICNGPCFSPDGRTLYHTDSGLGRVYAHSLKPDGQLGERRLWRQFDAAEGAPDGMCTDAGGDLWIAQWGGSCVGRYDSAGQLLGKVVLPVTQVSSCAFGGPELRHLFITTARQGLAPAECAAQPLAGGLFWVDLTGGPLPAQGQAQALATLMPPGKA